MDVPGMTGSTIVVRLYSILKDYAGTSTVRVEAGSPLKAEEIMRRLLEANAGFRRAVEIVGLDSIVILDEAGRRISLDSLIKPGALIHIIPPPEGGRPRIKAGILPKGNRVDIASLVREAAVSAPDIGGVGLFIGVVRGVNPDGTRVERLSYEAAVDLAEKRLKEIAERIAAEYSLSFTAAFHYYGDLEPGDVTMVIVVAGTSRKNVFPALERIVEEIKHGLPIWKKEYYADGTFTYIIGGRKVKPGP